MTFELLTFRELPVESLYEILNLRNEVFVVEQNCVYLDTDKKDIFATHVLLKNSEGNLIGYSRILPKGISYNSYVSIGRVVTSKEARGTGAGLLLMEESVKICEIMYPTIDIKIEAQSYLIKFYERFGFKSTGEDYILDGIPHREMIRNIQQQI